MGGMNRIVLLGIVMLAAAGVGTGAMLWLNGIQPPAVGDGSDGENVAGEPGPRRIVAFGPNVVESLFAMGAGHRLVGRDSWAKYPPAAENLPDVGSFQTANLEIIRSLKPDLILLQFGVRNVPTFAAENGIATAQVKMDSLVTIRQGIEKIGRVIEDPTAARLLNARIELELVAVAHAVRRRPRPSVLIVIGRKPGALADIFAAGRSYLGELVEIAGGTNLLAGRQNSYVPVPLEEIRRLKPEMIIELRSDTLTAAQQAGLLAEWNAVGDVPAAANKRIFVVSAEFALKPGPRIGRTARLLAKLIHPDVGPMK